MLKNNIFNTINMYKALEFIICDKYINKDSKKKPNVEYYFIKFSLKSINIFSEKTYKFEYYLKNKHNVWIDSILDILNYRLENLSDCKAIVNKIDKSVIIQYNENNTYLFVKIVNIIIEDYLSKTYNEEFIGVNLEKLTSSTFIVNDSNEIVVHNSTELFKINIDDLKENMFVCYNIPQIGYICGKIIFDNVFNNSRSLKNKIDNYNYEEYILNLSIQRELSPDFYARHFNGHK